MTKIITSIAVSIFSLLTACSSMKTAVSYDAKVNFSALKTYSWVPYPAAQRADVRLNYDFLDQTIREAGNEALRKKGLTLSPDAKADFRIRWYVAINDQANDAQVSAYHGFDSRGGWGYDDNGQWVYDTPLYEGYQRTYTVGSLVLDFVNAKTGKLIWRGAANSVVSVQTSQEQRSQMIRQAVKKILDEFPPDSKKK